MRIDVDNLANVLTRLPCFDVLASMFRGKEGYIVGGAVRDALTGLPVMDVDIVFPEAPTLLAKAFAKEVGGSWFWLDEQRQQSRVVSGKESAFPDYDFAPFRAPTLGQDLLDRDFTINSIAVAIDDLGHKDALIDPLCGLEDLNEEVLRMASAYSFTNDPLRILKGIRHATVLGLSVESETLGFMQQGVTELYRIAPERIRQEVWKIFSSSRLRDGLQLLGQSMVGNYLFGYSYSSCREELDAFLDQYFSSLEKLLASVEHISCWFADEVEQGLDNRTLVLWTFLLQEIDSELPSKLAEEWLLSRNAQRAVRSLCELNDGHVDKFLSMPDSARAFAWWADFLFIEPKLLLVALYLICKDDEQAEQHFLKWFPIIDTIESEAMDDLVDGYWLQSELGIKQGPEMTRAQRLVRHAEISGEVVDVAGAQKLLRQHYADMD